MTKPVYLDIMSADGNFIQQMRYDKRGFPTMLDGKITETYHYKDLEEFVFSKRPSLRNQKIKIIPSEQRV